MEEAALSPADYIQIVKNRKWSMIIPALIIFVVAAIVALTLPPVYKSTATILIEEQEIPADFVITTVTSYAEQRIQSINQRIMSTTKLLNIIKRFDLYPDKQKNWTQEEIVEKMREDVSMEPISAEVMDRRTGRASVATIAFTLSYEGKDTPAKIQRVANVITSLFLEENLQVRERQTSETTKFLKTEMLKVKNDLSEIEGKIAIFKKEHINELPELIQVNMQSLNSLEHNIDRLNELLRTLKERESSLQTQLSGIISESASQDKQRLDELKLQAVYLKSRFSDKYPDVIKTNNEIAELEKQINAPGGSKGKKNDINNNPVHITLASQLSGVKSEIDSVYRQIKGVKEKRDAYRARIEATPRIEEQFKALATEQLNTRAKYEDLMRKFMEAKVAQGLEKEQKGERFTLIDPAQLPEKPFKPNRLAIILIGLVLSLGAGVGAASLKEFTDQSVRKAETLTAATSFPVLAEIPEIVTRKDIVSKKRNRIILAIGIILFIVAAIIVFHFFIMDINVFWAKLMRKL
ncbi:MAG: hypothetical protein JJV92_07900 [Desulfosarcina sp.]|nr:hypothetical protein [Desulfobacterales bacterium]